MSSPGINSDVAVGYSQEVAAASWEGAAKHNTPVPTLFLGDAIIKVLKQVHPDTNITEKSMFAVSDMSAYVGITVNHCLNGHECTPGY